jgi:outer membrane protein insertion porin family
VGYGQQTQGISLSSGTAVGRFSRVFTAYSYQIIDLYDVDTSQLAQAGQNASLGSGSTVPVDLSNFGGIGRRYESTITPSWSRNTVDNPTLPRRGTRLTADIALTGGPLGGSVDYYRPRGEVVHYHPVGRRMALGLRTEIGYTRPYGGTSEIPYYQRYFLGGENQIRGYNARSVAPYDPDKKVSIGGNKYMLYNAEYYFDIFGPVRLLAFFDAGQAYAQGQGFWWKTMTTCTGAELRFTMPVLNVPFRLIYSWNLNRDYYQPPRAFKFAVGTTF